jgi:DNA-binding CsgD family transcriptional regulator
VITPQDTEVLIAISQAGADGGNWPPMLRALATHLQAEQARFFIQAQVWSESGALSTPIPEIFAGLRLGRVYTGEELLDRAPALAGAASDCRAIGLRLPQGVGWLMLSRQRGEFRAVDSAALAALAPHLEQACKIAASTAHMAQRAAQAEDIARRMGVGCVEFDARGQPQPCDVVAAELLAQLPRSPTLPRDLGQTALLALSPDLEVLCHRAPDGGGQGVLRATRQPLPPPQDIAALLHLSLSEARLVRALAQGASLSEAAQALGLTPQTARYYSKQVYAKLGLRGQPDLMRRVWTSALVLG